MKKTTRTKKFLANSVMLALLGIALIGFSTWLFEFRHAGGLAFIQDLPKFFQGCAFIVIMFLDFGLSVFGMFSAIMGGFGVVKNVKKM